MIHEEFAIRALLRVFDKIRNLIGMMSGKEVLNPSCSVNIVKIKDDFIVMTEFNNLTVSLISYSMKQSGIYQNLSL